VAQDLYSSPLFKMARRYAEANAHRWFILSAEHGMLDPKTLTRRYDITFNGMRLQERRTWAEGVIAQMKSDGCSRQKTPDPRWPSLPLGPDGVSVDSFR